MPVWLSLLIAVVGTVGFFGLLVGGVLAVVGGIRTKGGARFGVGPGDVPGTLNVWAAWDPEQFAIQIYRWRIQHFSPASQEKEGTFTVTYDVPQKEPFIQTIKLPENFKSILEKESNLRALFSFEFRTIEELSIASNFSLAKIRKIYRGSGKVPKIQNKLAIAEADVPTVMSLDYSELLVRRKKIKDLEAAAKAKAAKAAPKPAAAPAPAATAATPAPAATATPAPAAKPAPAPVTAAPAPAPAPAAPKPVPAAAAPTPAPQDKPAAAKKVEDKPAGAVSPEMKAKAALDAIKAAPASTPPTKSVRDVVSASNAKKETTPPSEKE